MINSFKRVSNTTKQTVKKLFTTTLTIVLSFVSLSVSMKQLFNVDVIDTINESLFKSRFAEAYVWDKPTTEGQTINIKRLATGSFTELVELSGYYYDSTNFVISDLSPNLNCKVQNYSLTFDNLNVGDIISCTPNAQAQTGINTFTVTPFDYNYYYVNGDSVDFQINVLNNTPEISSFSKTIDANNNLTFTAADFSSNYNDIDSINTTNFSTIKINSLPTQGILKLNNANIVVNQQILATDVQNLTYTPNANYSGNDTFSWNAKDGDNDFAETSANVNITINNIVPPDPIEEDPIPPLNQIPLANSDDTQTKVNQPVSLDVVLNDTDLEDSNDLLRVCSDSLSATNGTVSIATNNRTIIFTPTANSTASGTFTYKVCDSQGAQSLPVTSTVQILNPNISIEINKNLENTQIFPGTIVGMEVKTTNNSNFTGDITTTIKLDSSSLKILKDTVKEGQLSDFVVANNLNTNFSLLSANPFISQSSTATIEILSDDTIKIIYPQMLPNESRLLIFQAQSLVSGMTKVSSTAVIDGDNTEAEALLVISSGSTTTPNSTPTNQIPVQTATTTTTSNSDKTPTTSATTQIKPTNLIRTGGYQINITAIFIISFMVFGLHISLRESDKKSS